MTQIPVELDMDVRRPVRDDISLDENDKGVPIVEVAIQEKEEQQTEVEKDKYWDAIEVREIAQKFLAEDGTFSFPTNTPILYLFVDKMKNWGLCSRCSGRVKAASAYEFIITINHEVWSAMDERSREALVFHELLHVGFNMETGKYCIVPHDVEEFGRVVLRYGLWRDDVKLFVNAGMKAITLQEEKEDE